MEPNTNQNQSALAPQGANSPNFNPQASAGQAGSLDPTIAAPTSTMNASAINSQITGNTSGVIFPQAPGAPTKGTSANSTTPSPIPSAADIISQGTGQTPAETTNTSLLQKVASLIGQNKGQTTLTNQAETAAGVPGMQNSLNDLNTQLEALNGQATTLQQAAGAGGSIENNAQNNAQGRGITAGGLAPLTAGDLRNNQVQQAAIASQALTLKATIFGLQGKISLAQTAADNAAKAQFEDEQNQIDYQNALIAANTPQMNKEEKAQAALVTANLADRQTAINNAQDDKKTGIAMATSAMKNFPNDPTAQYNAQQALKLDPTSPTYLTDLSTLLGKYQQDPVAAQQALATLANTRANTKKTLNDIASTTSTGGVTDPAVQSWATAIKTGQAKISDITAADLKKNPNLKNDVIAALNANGNSQTDILKTTQASLKELNDYVTNNHGFTSAVGSKLGLSTLFGFAPEGLPGSAAADFTSKLKQVKNDVILPNLTLLHGLGRVTDREFQALTSAVTALSPNQSEVEFKAELANITKSIDEKANATQSTSSGTTLMTGPDGKQYNVPNANVAAFTKAGGKPAQ